MSGIFVTYVTYAGCATMTWARGHRKVMPSLTVYEYFLKCGQSRVEIHHMNHNTKRSHTSGSADKQSIDAITQHMTHNKQQQAKNMQPAMSPSKPIIISLAFCFVLPAVHQLLAPVRTERGN